MTRVHAADLSLTATGVAWGAADVELLRTNPKTSLSARLDHIGMRIQERCADADVLVIEDVPFGQYGVPIAMVHGAVRYALGPHFPVVTVTPATLKKYATGKGNARKPDMLDAARARLGWQGSNDDNVIDALWLLAAGLDHYGTPLCPMPQVNRAALAKVAWPDLGAGR